MNEVKKFENTENVMLNLRYLKQVSELSGNRLNKIFGFPNSTLNSYISGRGVPTVERMIVIRKFFGIRTILDFNMEPEDFVKRYKAEKIKPVVDKWLDELESIESEVKNNE